MSLLTPGSQLSWFSDETAFAWRLFWPLKYFFLVPLVLSGPSLKVDFLEIPQVSVVKRVRFKAEAEKEQDKRI